MDTKYYVCIVIWLVLSLLTIIPKEVHRENKLQLECGYYMQRAIENNKEDKIVEYQPQCADYLSFLTN